MAPAPRPDPGLAALALLAAASLVSCGGVFEEVAPPTKRVVGASFVPDFVRAGEVDRRVDVFIDVEPVNTFLTDVRLGDGIDFVRRSDPCAQGLEPPASFEVESPLQFCLELTLEETAEIGEREIVVELRAAGEPILATFTFFVLAPAP